MKPKLVVRSSESVEVLKQRAHELIPDSQDLILTLDFLSLNSNDKLGHYVALSDYFDLEFK